MLPWPKVFFPHNNSKCSWNTETISCFVFIFVEKVRHFEMDCTSGHVGNHHMQLKQNAMLMFVTVLLMKHVGRSMLKWFQGRVKSAQQVAADASLGLARLGKVMMQFANWCKFEIWFGYSKCIQISLTSHLYVPFSRFSRLFVSQCKWFRW